MKIESYGASDIGLVRLKNEDVWAQLPDEGVYLLADGMGGHKAGDVAASETVFHLCKTIKYEKQHAEKSLQEWIRFLDETIRTANRNVYQMSVDDPSLEGMGTTLCVALIEGNTLITAHVGDSRIYRVRKGRLTQLTQDHSLKDELIRRGELDESLALSFPHKNVITRAIGTQESVTPEVHTYEIEPSDLYFLCSDGLSDTMLDAQIVDIIEESETITEAVDTLILEAKKNGGSDNITIVMFQTAE